MSSLFEKCRYCGSEARGFLFCSNTCRLAALPSSNRESKISLENNPALSPGVTGLTLPNMADPVADGLEIMGSPSAELAADGPDDTRGELAQYENFFDRGKRNNRQI